MQDTTRAAKIEAAKKRRGNERADLITRLKDEHAHDLVTIIEKCGAPLRLVCTSCGCRKTAEQRCEKRWCPSCAYYIAAERVAKYQAAAAKFEWPLFMTLTMRNTPDPEGLKDIKHAWGKMRRRKLIRTKVKSGIIGYEVTNKGNGWHPHMHGLLDCRWLALWVPEPTRRDNAEEKARKCKAAAEELESLWAEILGQNSASIHIRRGDSAALVEVLKYSVKGSDLVESAEPVAPLIRLMSGMRLMSTFGEIRKTMKDTDPEDEDKPTGCACESCGGIGTMIPTEMVDRILRRAFDSRNAN